MNGKGFRLNGQKAISLLLAALAWAPEDGTKFQSPHPAIVKSAGKASVGQGMRLASPASGTRQLRPSLARAE